MEKECTIAGARLRDTVDMIGSSIKERDYDSLIAAVTAFATNRGAALACDVSPEELPAPYPEILKEASKGNWDMAKSRYEDLRESVRRFTTSRR